MSTPNEKYLALMKESGRVDIAQLDDLFNQLPPIKPDQLLGDWNGGWFDIGHPLQDTLQELKWTGKTFNSYEDVEPVIVNDNGKRVSWDKWGMASLHQILFRGVLSSTMVYDNHPIQDHFRYVDEHTAAGLMEGKGMSENGHFHFYIMK